MQSPDYEFVRPKTITKDIEDLIEESTKDKYLGDIAKQKSLKNLFAFYEDDKLVGFAIPRKDSDGYYRSGPIYVQPAHRRKGIAGKFLSWYFKGKKGRAYIEPSNLASQKTFESIGFKPTGKVMHVDGEELREFLKHG